MPRRRLEHAHDEALVPSDWRAAMADGCVLDAQDEVCAACRTRRRATMSHWSDTQEQKWYQATIIDVNSEENNILVHYLVRRAKPPVSGACLSVASATR